MHRDCTPTGFFGTSPEPMRVGRVILATMLLSGTWTVPAHAFFRLPECLRRLVGGDRPAPAATTFPEDRTPSLTAAYAEAFDRAGLAREDAIRRAEELTADLADVLRRAAATPDALPGLLAGLASGRHSKALGHPTHREAPRLGPHLPTGWVGSPSAPLDDAITAMAREGHLFPGRLRLPILWQWIDGALHEAVWGDRNDPRVFTAQLLLLVEEHLHLVQRLREYGGCVGPGWAVSQWARSSGVAHSVDREADVYAWMLEQWGERVPAIFRSAYPNRRFVP